MFYRQFDKSFEGYVRITYPNIFYKRVEENIALS